MTSHEGLPDTGPDTGSDTTFDCHAAMDRLFEFLDEEVSADVEARMQAHLQGCEHCFRTADFERRFLAAVHTARAAQGAPVPLRERVLDALRAEGWRG